MVRHHRLAVDHLELAVLLASAQDTRPQYHAAAPVDSFFSSLKNELVGIGRCASRVCLIQANQDIFELIQRTCLQLALN